MIAKYDMIDIAVSRIYEIDPVLLTARNRKENVALARQTAMYIRHLEGERTATIAVHYQRDQDTVMYSIRSVEGQLEVNPEFRRRYERIKSLMADRKVPFGAQYVRPGAKIWTRPDSAGKVIQGTITDVCDNLFQCGCFEDPDYFSLNRIQDGRVSETFETSLDIVFIEYC